MVALRSIGILFSIRMKHLIKFNKVFFVKDKGIIETSFEWWFERFVFLDKDNTYRIKTYLYPSKLLNFYTYDGLKIILPSEYKIHKDEWIVKLNDDNINLQSPQMLFQEFCKLNGYAGNTKASAGNSTPS